MSLLLNGRERDGEEGGKVKEKDGEESVRYQYKITLHMLQRKRINMNYITAVFH